MSCVYCQGARSHLPQFIKNEEPVGRVYNSHICSNQYGFYIELDSGQTIGIQFCPYCGEYLDSNK